MGRAGRVGRRQHAKIHLQWLGAIAVLAFGSLFLWFVLIPSPANTQQPVDRPNAVTQPINPAFLPSSLLSRNPSEPIGRPLFPYSVIPGGIQNGLELRNAVTNDPIVAAHYSGFDLAESNIIRSDRDRLVYTSYRMGDRIFWTKNKVKVASGEALITDGTNEARTRCGNRISETPLGPVSPQQPESEALDTALELPSELPLEPPPTTDIQSIERNGTIFIPPVVPIILGGGSTGGIPVNINPPPPPPATPTPEPATWLLISTGVSVAWMFRKTQKRVASSHPNPHKYR